MLPGSTRSPAGWHTLGLGWLLVLTAGCGNDGPSSPSAPTASVTDVDVDPLAAEPSSRTFDGPLVTD